MTTKPDNNVGPNWRHTRLTIDRYCLPLLQGKQLHCAVSWGWRKRGGRLHCSSWKLHSRCLLLQRLHYYYWPNVIQAPGL